MLRSNLSFSGSESIFKNTVTTAINRMVHHSVILELNVPRYRAEQARKSRPTRACPRFRARRSDWLQPPTAVDTRQRARLRHRSRSQQKLSRTRWGSGSLTEVLRGDKGDTPNYCGGLHNLDKIAIPKSPRRR